MLASGGGVEGQYVLHCGGAAGLAPPHLLETQNSPKEAFPNLCGSLHVLPPCSALCSRAAVLEERLDFIQSQSCMAAHV